MHNILKKRNNFKSVLIGHTKLAKNEDSNLIVFCRFFDPEKQVLTILNFNNYSIDLKDNSISNEIKELNLVNKVFEIDYKLECNMIDCTDYVSSEKKEKIFINKNGFIADQGMKISPLSGLIATSEYRPYEIKDIL